MTPEHIKTVCKLYHQKLVELGYKAERGRKNYERVERVNHIVWMLEQIPEKADKNVEKACRWLGFVQGVLWRDSYFTIDEMRNHNSSIPEFSVKPEEGNKNEHN